MSRSAIEVTGPLGGNAVTCMAGAEEKFAAHPLTASVASVTMPLCKIADRLGVIGVPEGEKLPAGIWISDGSANGTAYNWPELVDRMTARIGVDHAGIAQAILDLEERLGITAVGDPASKTFLETIESLTAILKREASGGGHGN